MKLLSLACLLGLVIAVPGAQDTVTLPDGRSDGVVYTVTLRAKGKSVTYNRMQFTAVTLGENSDDALTLSDGSTAQGTLDTVQIKTIGGILTYKRADLNSVTLNPAALDDVHKEYITRRYSVDQSSPEDLFKLAQWCMDKKLRPEAFELARMSLAVDANSSVADAAHDMLGEAWNGDKWVPKSQAPANPSSPGSANSLTDLPPPSTTEAGSTSEPGAVDEQAKRDAYALYLKLAEEYKGKLKDANDKEFKAFTDKYKPLVDGAKVQMDSLKKKIDELNGQINDLLVNKLPNEKNGNNIPILRTQLDNARVERDARQNDYQKAFVEQQRVMAQARSAREDIATRRQNRSDRFDAIRLRLPRLIGEGRILTETDMRTQFENALQ